MHLYAIESRLSRSRQSLNGGRHYRIEHNDLSLKTLFDPKSTFVSGEKKDFQKMKGTMSTKVALIQGSNPGLGSQ